MIDSHQHFWQRSLPRPFDYAWLDAPQNSPIRRDCLPEDLQPLIQSAGVYKTIFVQTQHHLDENRWVLKLAEQYDWIAGVVGWVDLASPLCERQLLEFKDHPKFVGVRHVTQDEPDDDFIVLPDVLRGLAVLDKHGVPFDMLFYVKHLRHAATLAKAFPNLTLVLDHLAKPHIKDRGWDDWIDNFRAAAHFPNVMCKLSGMVTEADWEHWKLGDLRPYVQEALNAFGPDRLMFGSDWPVCELAAEYGDVVEALREVLGEISDSEREAIFGGTAGADISDSALTPRNRKRADDRFRKRYPLACGFAVRIVAELPPRQLVEPLLEIARHWSGFAVANDAAIDLHHGNHFRRAAGEEALRRQ